MRTNKGVKRVCGKPRTAPQINDGNGKEEALRHISREYLAKQRKHNRKYR